MMSLTLWRLIYLLLAAPSSTALEPCTHALGGVAEADGLGWLWDRTRLVVGECSGDCGINSLDNGRVVRRQLGQRWGNCLLQLFLSTHALAVPRCALPRAMAAKAFAGHKVGAASQTLLRLCLTSHTSHT